MTDTRAALVAAAIDTLRESGFAAASARRIAQRAGCNQALVFYHFGTVNDLLMAPLSLPGMGICKNAFAYTDQSAGDRRVRASARPI